LENNLNSSVLAHLATKHPHPESVATDALAFILGRSSSPRDALGRLLSRLGLPETGAFRYVAQSMESFA